MAIVNKELEAARHSLLDLTMRNRLLNFRPSKTKTIKVVDEISREIYDRLVLQEKKMEFRPRLKSDTSSYDIESEDSDTEADSDETSILWKISNIDDDLENKHVDRFLQTNLKSEELQKRLYHISQQSQSIFEEQGYTVLYLVLGFIEWEESAHNSKYKLSPLILIPVELIRTKVGSSFQLSWTGEDIFTNISLQAKLIDESVSLPDFEMPDDKSGIDQYYQAVVESISKKPNWGVLSDINLGFFSFTKFVMYKDLDPAAWPENFSPTKHPLIKCIFDPDSQVSETGFAEKDVDEKINIRNAYHVMDADPSQIAIIEDVKSGKSLVVEGPPGTGKSQTIVNMIAELLSAEKSVLFVSEKMAALEVVKDRLDQVGLGDFCLELHSRKANKKKVLRELERTISLSPPKSISLDSSFDKLDSLKTELNDYASALRENVGVIRKTPFDLFCMKENSLHYFESINRKITPIQFSNVEKWNQADLNAAMLALSNISDVLPLVKPVLDHPWRGCNPGIVLPSDESDIESLIKECDNSLIELVSSIRILCTNCSMHTPKSLDETKSAISAAKVVASSKPVDKKVLLNPEWNKINEESNHLIQNVATLQSQMDSLLSKFGSKVFEQDIDAFVREYKELSAKFFVFRFFNSRYRFLQNEIESFYKDSVPKGLEIVISDLNEIASCIKLRDDIRASNEKGMALFGSHWKGENSDPLMLQSFADWIVSFRKQMLKDMFDDEIIDEISSGISREDIENSIVDVSKKVDAFVGNRDKLFDRISADSNIIFHTQIDEVLFDKMSSRLDLWINNLQKIQMWGQFLTRRDECLETTASPMIEFVDTDSIEPDDMVPCFEGNFAENLLHYAFKETPTLSNFVGELHEKKIKNFSELDKELITENRQRLAHLLYTRQPKIPRGASPKSEAGILVGEFNRKRGHMPIRKLMKNAGGLIQKIKPCFMMSPLSIAQFLDPLSNSFDVVIFDEASQVKPEDALGALLRGQHCVIIGDTRQLPPTSFFDKMVESPDEIEDDVITPLSDIESILHLSKRSFLVKDTLALP